MPNRTCTVSYPLGPPLYPFPSEEDADSIAFGAVRNFKQPFSATAEPISFLEEAEQFLNALKVHDHLGLKVASSTLLVCDDCGVFGPIGDANS
ncbi:unnamed protein product [Ceratitis capitata]|uniref:(Mediterranean fruit fly) hypothetical protein n=1 Tax=Ceratitis capitata TaxID=7213 RepID=A0A811UQ05_CERCA|nr:unnamed protein product [Ceratitis capitata]